MLVSREPYDTQKFPLLVPGIIRELICEDERETRLYCLRGLVISEKYSVTQLILILLSPEMLQRFVGIVPFCPRQRMIFP